jgi:radical SAM superfamily enzyme YgiQ (UPF0313 family)
MALDCLFLYTPKLNNFYRLYGEHIYGMFMPMGLFALSDYIHRNGYKVEVAHLGIEKINDPKFSLKEYLRMTEPKIVGLSLHWSLQTYDTIEAAKEIKAFDPGIFVVAGGFMASFFHQEILRDFDCIDGVVRGDGETPFLSLMKEFSNGSGDYASVPNLTWRDKGKIIENEQTYIASSQDLDSFDFTNFELIKNHQLYIKYASHPWLWVKGFSNDLNVAIHRKKIFPISVFRGCPLICSYCGGNLMSQKAIYGRTEVSVRSVEKVAHSISEAARYGYDTVYLPYLQFKDRPFYFQDLFEKIRRDNVKINVFLECWTLPPKDIIETFKNTFLPLHSRILISPESALEKVRTLNKTGHYSNEKLAEVINWSDELEIPIEIFFTIGLPFETLADMQYIKELQSSFKKRFKNVIIRTNHFELEPATPMYLYPERYNITKNRHSFLDFYKINNPDTKRNDYGLGYCNLSFSGGSATGGIKSFAKQIQSIQCRDFCLLSDFFHDFIKSDNRLLNDMIGSLSRAACGIMFSYWRINSMIRRTLRFR